MRVHFSLPPRLQPKILSGLMLAGVAVYLIPALILSIWPESLQKAAFAFLKMRVQMEMQATVDSLCQPVQENLEKLESDQEKMANALEESGLGDALKSFAEGTEEPPKDSTEVMVSKFAEILNKGREMAGNVAQRDLCERVNTHVREAIEDVASPQNFAEHATTQVAIESREDDEFSQWLAPHLQKLNEALREQWQTVNRKLLNEILLFLYINSSVYLLVGGIALFRPVHIKPLFVPTLLLVLASMVTTGFYLFAQNWFYTILYDRYWGWATAGWILVIFLFLIDIVFNEARITLEILRVMMEVLNAILQVIFSAIPG